MIGQDERIEELRDTHRLESKSQSEQIRRLQGQVEEADALLKATQNSAVTLEAESLKREAEVLRLQGELDKMKVTVKEEEEKRTKAIALLKTVRQKLVKAEREREDALKDAHALHAKDKEEREKEKAERQKLQSELERAALDRELSIQSLKMQSEKEVAVMREKYEQELSALRRQSELDIATAKVCNVVFHSLSAYLSIVVNPHARARNQGHAHFRSGIHDAHSIRRED